MIIKFTKFIEACHLITWCCTDFISDFLNNDDGNDNDNNDDDYYNDNTLHALNMARVAFLRPGSATSNHSSINGCAK